MRILIIVIVTVFLSGCYQAQIYQTRPDAVVGINIYTVDGGKIPGNWAYIVDDSVKTASRQIKASSHVCSLHTYPVDGTEALSVSIGHTMNNLFENAFPRSSTPSEVMVIKDKLSGTVIVKLDEFYPKFNCSVGPVEGYCSATTDISLTALVIDYQKKKQRYAHANAQRTSDGGGGQMCGGASTVISESVKRATKDVLERLAEKISFLTSANK